MTFNLSKAKIILSVSILVILLTLSPVNGQIVEFTQNLATSDSNIDGQDNQAVTNDDYTKSQVVNTEHQRLEEENQGFNNTDWSYYKDIIIDRDNVYADLTDFPVMLQIYDQDLKTKAQPDGDDIAFFSDEGLQLSHEIQEFDPSFNSSHAYLLAWVTTNLYIAEDTRIEMRYGNSTMSSQQQTFNTWSQYVNVWHLDDSLSTTTVVDSKGANDGTAQNGLTTTDSITGKLGNAINFDGVNDRIDVTNISPDLWSGVTLSTWFYKTANGDDRIFGYAVGSTTSDSVFSMLADNTGSGAGRDITARISTDGTGGTQSSSIAATNVFSLNNWHHAVITWDAVSEQILIYVDGELVRTATKDGDSLRTYGSASAAIGNTDASSTDRYFTGNIDETRIAQQAMSSEWIKTEFINQDDPLSFYSSITTENTFSFADYSDEQSSTDGIDNLGSLSHYSDLRRSDSGVTEYYGSGEGFNADALNTTGRSGNIDLGNTGNSDWSSYEGTISFWIYLNDLGDEYKPWGQNDHFEIAISKDNGNVSLDFGGNNVLISTYQLNSGIWYYIAAVWDENAQFLELYIGSEGNFDIYYANTTNTDTIVDESPNPSNEFMSSRSNDKKVDGYGDELRYYDKALSYNELKYTFDRRISGNQDGLRSYFPFDGQNLEDLGPNGISPIIEDVVGYTSNVPTMKKDDNLVVLSEDEGDRNSRSVNTNAAGKVLIGDGSVDWGSTAGTIAFWMRFDDVSTYQLMWGQETDFEIELQATGRITIDFGFSNFITSSQTLSTSTWYFIAVTWDESTNVLRLYIGTIANFDFSYNERLDWSSAVSNQGVTQNEFMTSRNGGSIVDGQGDELRYYDTALTYGDLSTSYDRSLTGLEDNLQSYYKFDEDSVKDYGPLGNDGSLVSSIGYSNTIQQLKRADSTFDWETKFTDIPYQDVATELAIKTGELGLEDLSVDYWTGSDWSTLFGVLSENSWNNITITSYLSSSEFIIRIYDTNRSLDYSNDAWVFDTILLTYYNQTIDWEHEFAGIDANREYYDLSIRARSNSDEESYDVYLWDQIDSWASTPQETISATTFTWYNSSINNYIGSTMYLRYLDTNRTRDYVSNRLDLDYVAINSYDIDPVVTGNPGSFSYNEGISTYNVVWTFTDDNPNVYNIYVDENLEVSSSSWSSGVNIVYNIGSLDLDRGNHNLTIEVLDDYTGRTVIESTVTVNDVVAPTISTPEDIQINEETILLLNWTINDRHADTYNLYINGTNNGSGSWTSGVELQIDKGTLTTGLYNYTIVAQDDSGNEIKDTIFITVVDEKAPDVIGPNDVNYSEDSTGNELSWDTYDNYPDYYEIYRNGSLITNSTWVSITNITQGIDGLVVGDYNYTIIVFDSSGNFVKDTVIVFSRDTTLPGVAGPSDFGYEFGNTGNSITWTYSDTNLVTVTLYIDEVLIFSFPSSSGNFQTGVDGLSLGNHNYTLTVVDEYGNFAKDEVTVTVDDTTAPEISSSANNQTITEVSSNNEVSWTATDLLPTSFSIYINDSFDSAGVWASGEAISYNLDALTKGFYKVSIYFNDEGGNLAISDVWITVEDETAPLITSPPNSSYEYGTTGNTIIWIATDTYAGNYTVYLDGEIHETGDWTSGVQIIVNIDGELPGTYNFTIVIADDSQNGASDSVIITVTDTVIPIVSDLTTLIYYEDESSKSVQWTGTDTFPANYIIYRNGTQVDSGVWSSGIQISLDNAALGLGNYNYSIIIFDQSGNYITDQATIQILDRISPTIDEPLDVTYEETSTGNLITWTFSDNNPDHLLLYRNGSIIQSTGWTSGISSFSIDSLAFGTYNYTIYINDTSGNWNFDTVLVFVEDNVNPVITSNPSDNIISEITTGNKVSWVATDKNANYYVIYNNGTPSTQIIWNTGNTINYNLDSLELGLSNITIQIFDISGNFISDTVWITVIDNTNPILTNPSDFSYEYGTVGNEIVWTPTDLHSFNYTIYIDGELNETGMWISSNPITLNVSGLDLGTHTILLVIEDESGNQGSDTVIVTVEDTTLPVISNESSDFQFNEDSGSFQISWTATDTFATTYRVFRNDALFISTTTWISGVPVVLDVSSLDKGTYNYTIVFRDLSGNILVSTVIVTVVDENNPVISNQPNDNYAEGTTGNTIDWPVSDSHPDQLILYRNGTIILNTSWETSTLSFNIDGLGLGTYNFTLTLTDDSGNSALDTVFITVFDSTLPVLNSPPDTTFSQETSGNEISWIANDLHAANYTIYRNGTLTKAGNWISGANITQSVNTTEAGTYNHTIYVQDQAGNTVSDTIIVVITADPVFVSVPNDLDYVLGDSGNSLSWIMTDIDNTTYSIYQDDIEVDSGNWNDLEPIVWSVDGLSLGTYNFTIVIFDAQGNSVTNQVDVTVSDMPLWDSQPTDETYSQGETSPILWNATDQFPDSYVVYQNGSFYTSGSSWNNATFISVDISGLSVGIYNFTIYVNDTSNNTITDWVIITIIDTTAPSILVPQTDYTTSEANENNEISWTITDNYASNYTILINSGSGNSTYAFGDWTSGVPIIHNIDELTKGIYTFYVILHDESGNEVQDSAVITIEDQTNPDINPADVTSTTIAEGSTGNWINVTATDAYAQNYEIYVNDNLNVTASGSWSTGTPVEFNLIGFLRGDYNVTIVFIDESGNTNKVQVDITVTDETDPSIGAPDVTSTTIAEGSTGNWINVTATDAYAQNYEIYVNDNLNVTASGLWSTGTPVEFNLIGFLRGDYNVTIVFIDESGNTNKVQVDITVTDETDPIIDLTDITNNPMAEDAINQWVNVTASDNYEQNFEIYLDEVLVDNGVWTSGESVSYDVSSLVKGTYNITFVFFDESSNSVSTKITFVVEDQTVPSITNTNTPGSSADDFATSWVNITATDTYADVYEIFVNDGSIESGIWISGQEISYDITYLDIGNHNITFLFTDLSGNTNKFELIIDIIDIDNPIIDNSSFTSTTIEEDSTGNWINVTASDKYAQDYEIWVNNVLNVSGSGPWFSGVAVEFNLIGFLEGDYNITIAFIDSSGNIVSYQIDITIIDVVDPEIGTPTTPGSIITEASTPNVISVAASDNHAGNYEIYLNSVLDESGTWTSGLEIDYDVDDLTKGTYTIRFVFYDVSGNFAEIQIELEVIDGTNPTIFNVDVSSSPYNEIETNYWVNVTATDSYASFYQIYVDDSIVRSGAWSSGAEQTYNFGSLPVGDHNITFYFIDQSGNTIQYQELVTILDVTIPTISDESNIPFYLEDSSGNSITWTTTETNPSYYEVYLDEILDLNVTWTGSIVLNIDGLLLGSHNITIVIYDTSGNFATDEVLIDVFDQTAPSLTNPPSNITMSEVDSGVEIDWEGVDTHPDMYIIYQDGLIVRGWTDWSSGIITPYSLDGLLKGIYIFNITMNDTSGNYYFDIVQVTVLDTTAPVVTSPSSLTYAEGDSTTLTWNATDSYPASYIVEMIDGEDEIELDSDNWSNGVNINNLLSGDTFGTYTIRITVYDESGNPAFVLISLTVTDETLPVFVSTQNYSVNYDEGQNAILNWTVTDLHAFTYSITRNGVSIGQGSWTSNVELTLSYSGLLKGTYTFVITFRDSSLNSATSTVTVTIEDNQAPLIFGDAEFIARRGQSGNNVEWLATDSYPGSYSVYRNDSQIATNLIWISGSTFSYDVFTPVELAIGFYNFTVVVFDQSGNSVTHTVIVNVVDGDPPVLVSSPNDLVFSEGNNTNSLAWTYTDATPGQYFILRNGTLIDTGNWQSGVEFDFPLIGVAKGIYNYTVIVSDFVYNNATNTVFVTVLDTTFPVFQSSPLDNIEYDEQTTGNSISWTISDNHRDNYYLYRNSTLISMGLWQSNVPLNFNIDNLSYGTYNYTIVVVDASLNEIVDTIYVTVYDVTLPTFDTIPDPTEYIEGETGYLIGWNVTDLHPAYYNLTYNGNLNQTGVWNSNELVFSIDGLGYGENLVTLILIDESGNFASSTIIIDVQDQTYPIITSTPSVLVLNVTDSSASLTWTAFDLNPGTYIVYRNGIEYQSRSWTNENGIIISVSSLNVGFYEFTIEITDDALNLVSSTITIRIKDPSLIDSMQPEFKITNIVYEGDVETINGVWLDVNNNPIANGVITYSLIKQSVISTFSTTTGIDGSYSIVLNYTNLDPGLYRWSVNFTSDQYQVWLEIGDNVEIKPHTYSLSLQIPTILIRGEPYSIFAFVGYNNQNGTQNTGLGLNQLVNRTGNADGVEVAFIMVYTTTNGNNGTLSERIFTDENGRAEYRISGGITTSILRITSISASISSSIGNNGASANLPQDSMPDIEDAAPGIFVRIIESLTRNIFTIILVMIGIISIFLVIAFFRARNLRRIELLNQSIKQAQEEVSALESMKAFIIQTKSKLTLYEELVNSDDAMNTGLVGGMVSAFSSFLNEIGRSGDNLFGFETMERGDVSLTVHRGRESNFIIITESKLPFILLNQIKQAQQNIEYEFKSFLQNTERGVRKLKRDQVHPQLTIGGFKIDLLGRMKLNTGNIRAVLRERSVSRAIKSNISLLTELPTSRYAEEGSFRLKDIMDFLVIKSINRQMGARIVMAAYQFGVIQKAD